MTINPTMTASQLAGELRRRSSTDDYQTVPISARQQFESDGWTVAREGRRKVKVTRAKSASVVFADRLWACLVRLGIDNISLDSVVRIGEHQIDLIAADDEALLVVKLFNYDSPTRTNLAREVEEVTAVRASTMRLLQREFPHRKVQFVVATRNATLTKTASENLGTSGLTHIDEDAIDYYSSLADHLGVAAKYQLLGSLMAGAKIENLETIVPAIRGRMSGYQYYSFLIEPTRLLKLGYILHRSKANNDLMPTYQRLVKKTRLRQVTEFVDGGGIFPNSLIVNIESGRRPLTFDRAGKQDGEAALGLLHLPQTYRSIYIIDGQHRLLGYANAARASTDLIPVVAFENLPRSRQVELFMEINENQQAVPKNLRNTLNADLLWDSEDLRERSRAVKLRIAQYLGEHRGSSLFDRIIVGEAGKSPTRCITIDSIKHGLDRSNLLGVFTKRTVERRGTLHRDTAQNMYETVAEFLLLAFNRIRDELPLQWTLGSADGGFVFINVGVESLVRLFSDIVDFRAIDDRDIASTDNGEDVFSKCESAILLLAGFLNELTEEEGVQLRRKYGSGGPTAYWRTLQAGLRERLPGFDPPGLDDYLRDQERRYNSLASEVIRDVETYMKADVKRRLVDAFGARWQKDGVPHSVFADATSLSVEKNRDRDAEDEISWWDCLHLIDYQKILTKSQDSWKELFEADYSPPDLRGKGNISRADKTSWLVQLNKIRNQSAHEYVVTEDEYNFLVEVSGWLLPD